MKIYQGCIGRSLSTSISSLEEYTCVYSSDSYEAGGAGCAALFCVPGMALILLVLVKRERP